MQINEHATHVSLAHRYCRPEWDTVENREHYGDDFSTEGVGHNMVVVTAIQGQVAQDVGVFAPVSGWKEIDRAVKSLLDHRCLFEVEAYFKQRVSTLENIGVFVAESLFAQPPPLAPGASGEWSHVRVHEDRHWAVTCRNGREKNVELHYACDQNRERGRWRFELTMVRSIDATSGLAVHRGEIRRQVDAALKVLPPAAENSGEASFVEDLFVRLDTNLKGLDRLRAYAPSGEIRQVIRNK